MPTVGTESMIISFIFLSTDVSSIGMTRHPSTIHPQRHPSVIQLPSHASTHPPTHPLPTYSFIGPSPITTRHSLHAPLHTADSFKAEGDNVCLPIPSATHRASVPEGAP